MTTLLERTAVCATVPNPDALWFSDRPEAIATAKSLCLSCPLLSPCGDGALERREAAGVWGALSVEDRGELLAGAAPLVAHGERAGYAHGCRCRPCTTANSRYVAARRAELRWRVTRARIVIGVLTSPQGRGAHRAWPGQLLIEGVRV